MHPDLLSGESSIIFFSPKGIRVNECFIQVRFLNGAGGEKKNLIILVFNVGIKVTVITEKTSMIYVVNCIPICQ